MRFLQKAVMPARERSWLAAGDDLICGYVVDAADAAWADTASKLFQLHGLGFVGSPYAAGSEFVDVVRIPVSGVTPVIPALGTISEVVGGPFVDHPPFDPRGFAPGEKVTPLSWLDPIRTPPGTELWRVFADGHEEMVATYPHVASGWTAVAEYKVPRAGWLVPSRTLGTFGVWQGTRVLADVLPNGKVVVASDVGLPEMLLVERGIWATTVEASEVSELGVLRMTGTWEGLAFQVVRALSDTELRLVYLGRDALAAEAAGLQKTDAGVYEATVARGEVTDIQAASFAPGVGATTETTSPPSGFDRDALVAHGRELFARFTDATEFNVIDLPDGLGIVLIHAVRGGGKLYIAPDFSVLFSSSSQNDQVGLAAFREGRRTTGEKLLPLAQRTQEST